MNNTSEIIDFGDGRKVPIREDLLLNEKLKNVTNKITSTLLYGFDRFNCSLSIVDHSAKYVDPGVWVMKEQDKTRILIDKIYIETLSEDIIFYLIGHEFGHLYLDHVKPDAKNKWIMLPTVKLKILQNKRQRELSADLFAISAMLIANIDPKLAILMMEERLIEGYQEYKIISRLYEWFNFLCEYPDWKTRINNVKSFIS